MKLHLRPKRNLREATCDLLNQKKYQDPNSNTIDRDSSCLIYADAPYDAFIVYTENEECPQNISVYLNTEEYKLSTSVEYLPHERTVKIQIDDSYGPFSNCYGYAQLIVRYHANNKEHSVYSAPLEVMLRSNKRNEVLQRIAEYVFSTYSHFLKKETILPSKIAKTLQINSKSIEAQILLLQLIGNTYEQNQPYFMANARTKAEWSYKVAETEHLTKISPTTLQYIAQHPEELSLVGSETGIQFRGKSYYPRKTMFQDIRQSRNTYENECLVSFLRTAIHTSESLMSKLKQYISLPIVSTTENNGYFLSTTYILQSSMEKASSQLSRIRGLVDRLQDLYWIYKSFLPIEDRLLWGLPQSSAVFRNTIPYRQVYDVMCNWYGFGEFDVISEPFILPLLRNYSLYEYYVYLKIAEEIEEEGYIQSHKESKFFKYPTGTINPDTHLNTLVFRRDTETITLYIQPVIYGQQYNTNNANGITLRRTTTLGTKATEKGGTYRYQVSNALYTPDCILKYSNDSESRYLIIDAKYRKQYDVWNMNIQDLAFKYLFSVQTTADNATLVGVIAAYGKVEEEETFMTVHDIYQNNHSQYMLLASLSEILGGKADNQKSILKQIIELLRRGSLFSNNNQNLD